MVYIVDIAALEMKEQPNVLSSAKVLERPTQPSKIKEKSKRVSFTDIHTFICMYVHSDRSVE